MEVETALDSAGDRAYFRCQGGEGIELIVFVECAEVFDEIVAAGVAVVVVDIDGQIVLVVERLTV